MTLESLSSPPSITINEIYPFSSEDPRILSEIRNLSEFDRRLGKWDGEIDLQEYYALHSIPSSALFSKEALQRVREALLARTGASDLIVKEGQVTLLKGVALYHFDVWPAPSKVRLRQIEWFSRDGRDWEKSILYYYDDASLDQVGAQLVISNGGGAESIFPRDDALPKSPEEFSLITSGFLARAEAVERRLWLWDSSGNRQQMNKLKEAVLVSHPRLVARFLHALMQSRKKEDPETRKIALRLFDETKRWLTGRRTNPELSRTETVLRMIFDIAIQGIFVLDEYLPQWKIRSDLAALMNPQLKRNLEYLLTSLQLNDLPSSLGEGKTLAPHGLKEWRVKNPIERGKNEAIVKDLTERYPGDEFQIRCANLWGGEVLTGGGFEFYPPQKGKRLGRPNLRGFYQEALVALTDWNVRQGTFWTPNAPYLKSLYFLSISLKFENGLLKGDWQAWMDPGEDEIESRRLRRYDQLIREGYIVIPSREKGRAAMAIRPDSLLESNPLHQGLPFPLTQAQILIPEDEGPPLLLVNERGDVTTATGVNSPLSVKLEMRRGNCFVYRNE